jgi:dipeptidyl aminopeptidase/acylaminoacyl peptidase
LGEAGAEALAPRAAEFGVPQWVFGMSTYDFVAPDRIVCAFSEQGRWRLGEIDVGARALREIATPYTDVSSVCACEGATWFVGGSPVSAPAIVRLQPESGVAEVVSSSSALAINPAYFSQPRALTYPTGGGELAHAFFYPPCNRDFGVPPGERPPLLVVSHGGPTAASHSTLNLRLQYWTSRGFGVLDVNYRGSSGFGRAYRRALDGRWGVTDVEDCVRGAQHLVHAGLADPARLAIRGSSAGGFTTLCALTFHDVFAAGASYYGISDLEALVRDTHKFEARYLDRLVGPYPAERVRYQARSPIHHVERLACPTIFFQGRQDKVTPPDQTERMVEALRAKGIAVAYVAFGDEAHGFRRAENVERALTAELAFYARVFGFTPADGLAPLVIDNLQ